MNDLEGVKAGDKLFVNQGTGRTGYISVVKRVTPTGRVIAEHGEFNPNGRKRGDHGWSRAYARLATEGDLAGVYRAGLVSKLSYFRDWEKLSPDDLKTVAAIVDKHRQS